MALPVLDASGGRAAGPAGRAARLRSPLLLALAVLLAIEGAGGLLISFARLAWGALPGETLHVVAGAMLAFVYAVYQWQHWLRVGRLRGRLDWVLGWIAAGVMALTLASGLVLAAPWWAQRVARHDGSPVHYPAALSGFHTVGSMLVLSFVGAHLGAVLLRDARLRAGESDRE